MTLHAKIMNIPSNPHRKCRALPTHNEQVAYNIGHVDARHDAAELALKYDAFVEEMRQILKDGYRCNGRIEESLKHLDAETK